MHRLYAEFPGGARAVALLFLRAVAGIAFMHHGWGKIQNPLHWMGDQGPPAVLQAAAAISEFGGGLAWVLGALTPLFSLGLIGTMGFAVFLVHIKAGHHFVAKPGDSSYESALVYLAVAVVLLIVGPGRLSVDALLFGRRPVAKPEPARELAG